jgi:hypothetical protein
MNYNGGVTKSTTSYRSANKAYVQKDITDNSYKRQSPAVPIQQIVVSMNTS